MQRHIKRINAGEYARPEVSEVATPNPDSVNFALEKKALIVTGSEMSTFFTAKLKVPGGNPDAAWLVRFGG